MEESGSVPESFLRGTQLSTRLCVPETGLHHLRGSSFTSWVSHTVASLSGLRHGSVPLASCV